MDFFVLVGVAIGLSMDALAVSVTNGVIIKQLQVRQAVRIAFFFGFFQALMPLIGWAAGITFSRYIQAFDHWIAFGLLLLVGGRMIAASFGTRRRDEEIRNCLHLPTLLLLSIATSIDALAVGITFAFLEITIWLPILIIGMVTFIMCFIGINLGSRFSRIAGKKIEIAGGLILISIGIKILIEHLMGRV